MVPYHNIKKCPDCSGEVTQQQDILFVQVVCKNACQGLQNLGDEMVPYALITIDKSKFQKEVLTIRSEIIRFFDEALGFSEKNCKLLAKVLTEGKVPFTEISYTDSIDYKR